MITYWPPSREKTMGLSCIAPDLAPLGGEDHQVAALEWAGRRLAFVFAEMLDQVAVEFLICVLPSKAYPHWALANSTSDDLRRLPLAQVPAAVAVKGVDTMDSSDSALVAGFWIGNLLGLGILALVFWFAGRWGFIGVLIRIVCAALFLIRLVNLIRFLSPS